MSTVQRRMALQGLISVVALAGVVWWATRQHMPTLPGTGRAVGELLGGVALYALATLCRGERWHRVLTLVGVPSRRSDAYSLTCVGYMGNNTLPARAGDLLKTGLTAQRTRRTFPEILGATVAERVLDAAALAIIFLVLGGLILRGAGLPALPTALAVVGGLAVLGAVVVALPRLRRTHPRIGRLIALAVDLARPSRALLSPTGALLFASSVAIWALEASVYLAVAHAVAIPLSAVDALYVVALTNLVALIPAAPGYVGTFDAAVVFAVKALTGTAASTSYVLALRLVLFVPITIVGLVLLFVRHGGVATVRRLRRGWRPRPELDPAT